MAITTLNQLDSGSTSRTVINDNFTDVTSSLALKANLASPTFTGSPVLPTGTTITDEAYGAGWNGSLTPPTKNAVYDKIQTLGGTSFSTTEIFNGTSPTSFTDLDLSSVVGVAQRMVLLKFISSGGNVGIAVKTKGDADTYTYNSGFAGISNVLLTTSTAGTTIVKTDASGIIEWYTSGAQAFTIDVLAYW